MTTIDTVSNTATGSSGAASSIADWITTSDHKRIGRAMIVLGLLALLGIAVVGGLLGFERIDVNSVSLGANSIPQLFAIDRIGLAFFAVVPVMLGLGVAVVPLQVGARSLAFPRLAAAGFWAWFFGMALIIISICANGGPNGGATKYVALFISSYAVMLGGLTFVAIALAATVLTTRAPGMNMRRVPLFAWSVLVSTLGLILVLPVTIGAVIYLYLSYRYNREAFGGNTGILHWVGFSLTQPTTFVYALPAIGFAAEMVPVTARGRMPMRGVVLGGLGLVGVAAFAGVTQTEHPLPWSGSKFYLGDLFWQKLGDILNWGFFNVLPVLGAVVVLLLAPLAFKGSKPKINAPFVFGIFGLLMVLVGMAGGILNGIIDLGLRGTVFEEGAYVYVCYGALLAGMGAVAYWGPKLWGRRMPDKAVGPLALLGVLATVLAGFPYYIAGFANQPGDFTGPAKDLVTFSYSGPHALWNTLATIGHGLMVITVLAFIALALKSFTSGAAAGDDPWDAHTLEWATSSPPPTDNFAAMHTVASAEPLIDLKPSGEAS